MNHASFFSGIGACELAAEWMGWENKFHCEINPFGSRVLKYYWPKSEHYSNIKESNFEKHRNTIDVLSGGFPCQPYSSAGKRLGNEDDRHLWPEMLRGIGEIAPRWVVGENVRGLTNWNGGLVFDEVQADLEAIGYEVLPFLLPACAVNAPHRRDRIWFISRLISNSGSNGRVGNKESSERLNGERGGVSLNESESLLCTRVIADSSNARIESLQPIRKNGIGEPENATDTGGEGLSIATCREQPGFHRTIKSLTGCESGRTHTKTTRWSDFPTQSPVCIRDDGISAKLDGITFSSWRNESIKAAGNAMVPQLVYQIFKAIEMYENIYNQ